MMFVDDVIGVVALVAYLVTIFQGHASGFLALVVVIFVSFLIWHINMLIKKGASNEK